MPVVSQLMVRAGGDFSELTKKFQSLQKKMSSVGKDLEKTGQSLSSKFNSPLVSLGARAKLIGATVATALAGISVAGVKSAMEYESSMQQVSRIMGENAVGFEDWAKTQASAFNMSRLEAVKYGAVYGNLMTSITSDQKQTTQYTMDLLKASAVVASATGRDITDVMERIRSGLLGNTEAIEDLGINVNIAMIESTSAFQRFANGKSWDQLNFQTQQQIRLFAILEQASSKFGDSVYNNTSSSLMQFTALLKDAQLNIGQAFIPLVNSVMPILIDFANVLVYVTNIFKQFTAALFGAESETATSANAAAKAQTNLSNATKKAGAAAKGSIAAFDEVNQLQEKMAANADDAAGGGSGAPTGTKTEKAKKDILPQWLIDAANETSKALSPLGESFGKLSESIGNLGESIRKNEAIQKFLSGLRDTLRDIGKGVVLSVAGAIEILAGSINILSGAIGNDFESTLKGIEQVVSGTFDIITGIFYTFFPEVAKKMQEFKKDFGEKWASLKEDVKIYGDPTKLELSDFANFFQTKLSKTWENIKTEISIAWPEIKKELAQKWEGITGMPWNDVEEQLTRAWKRLNQNSKTLWSDLGDIIKNEINNILGGAESFLNFLIDGFNDAILAFNLMKSAMGIKGWTMPVEHVKLPRLAKGGIVSSPTLAMIGESGKEAVIPLEDTSFVDTLAGAIGTAVLNAMQFNQSGNQAQPGQAVFNLDGTQFARAIIPLINQEQSRRGNMAIQGV